MATVEDEQYFKSLFSGELERILDTLVCLDKESCERYMNALHEHRQSMTDSDYLTISEEITFQREQAMKRPFNYISDFIDQQRQITTQETLNEVISNIRLVLDSDHFIFERDGSIRNISDVDQEDELYDELRGEQAIYITLFLNCRLMSENVRELDTKRFIKLFYAGSLDAEHVYCVPLETALMIEVAKIDTRKIESYHDLIDIWVDYSVYQRSDTIQEIFTDKFKSISAIHDWIQSWIADHKCPVLPTPQVIYRYHSLYEGCDPHWPRMPGYLTLIHCKKRMGNTMSLPMINLIDCTIKNVSAMMQMIRGDMDWSYVPEELALKISEEYMEEAITLADKLSLGKHPKVKEWLTHVAIYNSRVRPNHHQ